jgi:hypothetical protein
VATVVLTPAIAPTQFKVGFSASTVKVIHPDGLAERTHRIVCVRLPMEVTHLSAGYTCILSVELVVADGAPFGSLLDLDTSTCFACVKAVG